MLPVLNMKNLMKGKLSFLTVLLVLLAAGSAIVFAASTANPNASAKAKAVLDYFYGLPSRSDKRVVSGQFLGHCSGTSLSGVTEIFNETGHWLGMVGADYYNFDAPGPASLSEITNKVNPILINYWNNGGLVMIQLHASNPQTGGGCRDTTINLDDVLNFGTTTGSKWKTELDTIASGLQQLENAGVVVLWRPFHEMNGGWFWWGAKGRFVDLWRQMFNYFTNVKHLDNLLWVYGPNDGSCLGYYPENEYVDMTGVDEYGDGVYLDGYNDLLTTGKPFGLSEFGPCCTSAKSYPVPGNYDYARLIQRIKASYPMTTFFQCWGSPWGIENNLNAQGLLNDSWIVNREDLPDFDIPVIPDTTPPGVPAAVRDGTGAADIDTTILATQLSANWAAATDPESTVSYKYAIGTSAGATNITNGWISNNTNAVTKTGLALTIGQAYYFSVRAVSSGGESAATNSDGQTVEASNNLALGKAVTASSVDTTYAAANAVDGNTGTRWGSLYSDPQWIYVDLGSTYSVNRVVLNWEAAYGRAYEIQVSANAADWTQAYITTSGDGGTDEISFSAVSARYVRMYGTQRATSYGYSLWEFEVYASTATADTTPPSAPGMVRDGTSLSSDIDSTYSTSQLSANWNASTDPQSPVSYKYAIGTAAGGTNTVDWTNNPGTSVTRTGLTLSIGTRYYFSVKAVSSGGESAATNSDGQTVEASNNLALGKAVTASSVDTAYAAANAVDGNAGTRWGSLYSDPQWIYVDLGQAYNVNRVVLNWEAAYGTSYQVQVSANAVDWTQSYATTSGDGGTDDISFPAVSARYVRMYGMQRATSYGYSLYEFEVYGSTAAADTTAPSAPGAVRDGTGTTDINSTTSRTQLSANWTAATDAQSGISGYNYAIGTTAGATNVTNGWLANGTNLTATKTGLSLTIGTTYYFSVKATNGAGLTGSATNSNGQVVLSTAVPDTTAPSAPGTVRDGPTAGTDAGFTYSTTTLSANWTASTDNESGITNYQFSIGTTPGNTQTSGWATIGNVLSVTKNGLSLSVGTTYYFSVKAVNGAGLSGPTTNSDGQFVKEVNTGDTTPPSNIVQVRDGNETGIDADVTHLTDELSANWDNSADSESGIFRYYYAIGSLPGATDITGWTDNGVITNVTETGLNLTIGSTYYFSVKAENGVGLQSAVTNSNGQIVLSQDSQGPLISNVSAQGITHAGATVTWETDEPSTSQVEYGLTAIYGSLTGEYIGLITAHSVTLTGLLPETQYHFRVISRDGSGNESISFDYNFTTLSPPKEVAEVKAYPNPCDFKNGQVIKFKVGAAGSETGKVKIFTLSGKLVRALTSQYEATEISWDGRNESGERIARGVYIYKLIQADGNTITGKIAAK